MADSGKALLFESMRSPIAIALLVLVAAAATAQPIRSTQDLEPTSNPRAQALKLYLVIQKQDWEALYSLVLFSPKLRLEMGGQSKEFAAGVRQGINESDSGKAVKELFDNMSDIAVGEPVINGDKADIPTSSKVILKGRTAFFKGTAHMIRDGQSWKWDLSFTEDVGAATSQQLIALIGTPSASP